MALTGEKWNQAGNIIIDRYDWAPFGHPASANPPGSTYRTFGHTDQAKWLTFHSVEMNVIIPCFLPSQILPQ